MSDIVERLNEYAEGQWHPEDVSDLITDAADEIERLREALHEWDALIVHQYNGSREAMSALNEAGQNTARLLYGDDPWPEPRKMEVKHG